MSAQQIEKVETLSCEYVAKALGTAPPKIKAAIKNGTLPIGFVADPDNSSKERIVIIKTRFDKWINGEL